MPRPSPVAVLVALAACAGAPVAGEAPEFVAADTLEEMLDWIDAGKSQARFTHHISDRKGSIFVGDPSEEEEVGACLLHKVGNIVYMDMHMEVLGGLQIDVASCCTRDRKGCMQDVAEPYKILGQVKHLKDPKLKHKTAAHAAGLLVQAAQKRVKADSIKDHHARFFDACGSGDPKACSMKKLGGDSRRDDDDEL
mmetsp:Transcript_62734/g.181837  ORF Transcript_62734/g.181837 Transcript_62734/m.181837 type:complete len:195 (-) Transcript_62734:81-665(-)